MKGCFWFTLALMAAPLVHAQGNDVYNFYFQKGPAPQTVIQSGGGQAAGTASAAPVQSLESQVQPPQVKNEVVTKAPAEATVPVARDYHHIEFHLGPTRIGDEVGSGLAYTAGAQLNFNRYFGVRLLAHRLAVESASYDREIRDRDQSSNLYGGQAAFVFTPIHMDLLGHKLLRVSAIGGLMSQRKWQDADGETQSHEVKTAVRGFAGVSAGVAVNDNVGVEASVAMLDGGKVGQATGSLVFSF